MDLYTQTTQQLFDLQKYAIKLGLENISYLCQVFGNPQLKFPIIHIAGTNGKGSTAFYISNILQTCGLKVGLYTSPHLVDFRERIRINNQLIEKDYIIQFWKEIKESVLRLKATFFDTTTLMALKYFADKEVDVAVIETGLGGRLDSTNIVKPDMVVITPIGYDHQKQLGKTLKLIAFEKAGIIKDKCIVFVSEQKRSVLNVIKKAVSDPTNFYYLPDIVKIRTKKISIDGLEFEFQNNTDLKALNITIPTPAEYQAKNIALSLSLSMHYCEKNKIKFPTDKIIDKIRSILWPGRMQLIQKNPFVFYDVSHNIDGIKFTIETLNKILDLKKTFLLLGLVSDKDAISIVKFLAGKFRKIIITEPDTYRKQEGKYLLKLFQSEGQKSEFIKDLKMAYEGTLNSLTPSDGLIVLGSHYLVGALLKV